jgi:hypothetical protein
MTGIPRQQAVEKGIHRPSAAGKQALKSLTMDIERHIPSPKG